MLHEAPERDRDGARSKAVLITKRRELRGMRRLVARADDVQVDLRVI